MLFRKKPVVIKAIQWDGSEATGQRIREAFGEAIQVHPPQERGQSELPPRLFCATLEGQMQASTGDWIIQGVKGEVYPCKPDIFSATYEAV